MNLDKAIELLSAVSAIPVKAKKPKIRIVYKKGEGYTLGIKTPLANEYRSFLNEIAKAHNLRITESKGYLMVYGYR